MLNIPLLQKEIKIKNPTWCPKCKKTPKTQTTYRRRIITLSGERHVDVHIKYCKEHGAFNNENLAVIQKICPPQRTFDTKVMIAIGFLRWLFNYQREEIQLLLEVRGIRISTGEISRLSEEFLLRFYVLHKKYSPQMKELFKKNGGFILHLDGSAESGNEITFTAKDGITGITIDSWIMPSEGREYIKPFLENIRDAYGTPLVVLRDMWEEIAISVSEIFPSIKQQICHYHFVRNLGDILFKHRYEELRRKILNTKILAKLLVLKRNCLNGTSNNKIATAERYWVILAIEYILHPRECRSDYPFVLPYLEIFNRLAEAKNMLRKIVMWNAWHNLGVWVVLKFDEYLGEFIENDDMKISCTGIKRIWGWFDHIRRVLQISRELSGKEQNNVPTNAEELKQKLECVLMKIREESREAGDNFAAISEKICNNCQEHMEELFVEVKDKNGREVKIVRHNGIEELNHRWSRMHIRRRTGRSRTTKEMTMYGALLAIFSNIECEEYVKTVFADVKDFVREMQDFTEEELMEAKRLIRTFPQRPLVKSDTKRPEILQEFVRMIDDELDDISVKNVEKWLSHFY